MEWTLDAMFRQNAYYQQRTPCEGQLNTDFLAQVTLIALACCVSPWSIAFISVAKYFSMQDIKGYKIFTLIVILKWTKKNPIPEQDLPGKMITAYSTNC